MSRSVPTQRGAAVALLALALTACAGPKAPLQVGVRELPSDVVLGDRSQHPAQPVSVPVPPVALPLSPAQVPVVGLAPAYSPDDGAAPPPVPPPAPPAACDVGTPTAAKGLTVPDTVSRPPSAARYSYQARGGYEMSGANAAKVAFPDAMARTVRDVVQLPTAEPRYRFTVDAELGRSLTSTTYTLVPASTATSPVQAAGLYLTKVVTRYADGSTDSFTPAVAPGLLLLPFPTTPGTSFRQSGVDARTGTTLSYTATVGDPQQLDVCGTVIGTVPVHLDGQLGPSGGQLSPQAAQGFQADYAFATAYGGLSVYDKAELQRTTADGTFSQQLTATIVRAPQPAAQNPTKCADPCSP